MRPESQLSAESSQPPPVAQPRWIPRGHPPTGPDPERTGYRSLLLFNKCFNICIHTFFDQTEQAIQDLKIIPSGMWNMDECGCQLGCLGNQMKIVVVKT